MNLSYTEPALDQSDLRRSEQSVQPARLRCKRSEFAERRVHHDCHSIFGACHLPSSASATAVANDVLRRRRVVFSYRKRILTRHEPHSHLKLVAVALIAPDNAVPWNMTHVHQIVLCANTVSLCFTFTRRLTGTNEEVTSCVWENC